MSPITGTCPLILPDDPVILKKRIGLRIEQGHPWIFGNEIAETEETVKPGDIVTVFNSDKRFIGKGFINSKSQIAIRLLTRNEHEIIDDRSSGNGLEQPGNIEKARIH